MFVTAFGKRSSMQWRGADWCIRIPVGGEEQLVNALIYGALQPHRTQVDYLGFDRYLQYFLL